MHPARLFCFLVTLLASSTALAAETIVAGKQYRGGTELSLDAAGAQFRIPKGWVGLLPVGDDSFLIRSTKIAGMLQVFLTPGDTDTLADSMASVVSVEDDVNLIPVGNPRVGKDRITNSYYATNTEGPSKGYAVGIPQPGSYGIGIIGLGPMNNLSEIRLAVETVASSVTFAKP